MTDLDIYCNYGTCRARLTDVAFITSCSHAFCENHAKEQFLSKLVCPACKTPLHNNKYDIMKADLNPSEGFCSMILAGLKPETIIDIAQRAIGFWSYQIQMEKLFHTKEYEEMLQKKNKVEEQYMTQINNDIIKMQHMQQKIEFLEQQLNNQRHQIEELREKYNEKARKHAALMQKCALLERKQLVQNDNPRSVTNTEPNLLETKNFLSEERFQLRPGFNVQQEQQLFKEKFFSKRIKKISTPFTFLPIFTDHTDKAIEERRKINKGHKKKDK